MGEAQDYHGNPLAAGDRVRGWVDGVQYTATMQRIEGCRPGEAQPVIVVKDDGTLHETWADALEGLGGSWLEREAWADYQWRKAHPWQARLRRLRQRMRAWAS